MSLFDSKKDYEQLVKENIKKAKLLYNLSEKDRILMNILLEKKELIKEKNGIFANLQLKQINAKIEKIQDKYKQQNKKI